MLARILALFLIMPAVELALLMYVSTIIGFWETVAIIVVTGVVGGLLAKHEGLSAWNRLNTKMASGGLPGKELMDGVIILIAGALLITPGVITDVIGFMGLIPPTRALIRKYAMKRFQRKAEDGSMGIYMGGFDVGDHGDSFDPYAPPSHGGGPSDRWEPEDDSETDRDPESAWSGSGRRIPRHDDEISESGSGSDPADRI